MEDEPINSNEPLEITYALYKITDDTLFYIYGEDPITYITPTEKKNEKSIGL